MKIYVIINSVTPPKPANKFLLKGSFCGTSNYNNQILIGTVPVHGLLLHASYDYYDVVLPSCRVENGRVVCTFLDNMLSYSEAFFCARCFPVFLNTCFLLASPVLISFSYLDLISRAEEPVTWKFADLFHIC